jgi:hypothetical protein
MTGSLSHVLVSNLSMMGNFHILLRSVKITFSHFNTIKWLLEDDQFSSVFFSMNYEGSPFEGLKPAQANSL